MLSQIVAIFALLGLSIGIQALYFMWGWGLEPRSWFWIIALGFIGHGFIKIAVDRVSKELKGK